MVDNRFHRNHGPFMAIELAKAVDAELMNVDGSLSILDVAPISNAQTGQMTFLDNRKYVDFLNSTQASLCIIHPDLVSRAPAHLGLLVHKKPYHVYAKLAALFYPPQQGDGSISPQAIIDKTAKIGKGTTIMAGAYIGAGVEIGEGCIIGVHTVIQDNVVIGDYCSIADQCSLSHTILGNHVRMFSGVRVGQAGFGYAMGADGHLHVPQLGRVMIGDHVEIGANTTIDRGAGPDTVIEQGVIIDNLVQIAHNVKIGKGCVIAAQTGIAGSTELGDFVVCGGQVGIAGHVKVGSGAQLGAQAGVSKSLDGGKAYSGTPAVPLQQYLKQAVALGRIVGKNSRS